ADEPPVDSEVAKKPSLIKRVLPRRQSSSRPPKGDDAKRDDAKGADPADSQMVAADTAIAAPQSVALPATSANDPSDALARALRGSAATTDLLAHTASRSSAFDATDAITGTVGTGAFEVSLGDSEVEPRARTAGILPRRDISRPRASASHGDDIAPVADAVKDAVVNDAVVKDAAIHDAGVEEVAVQDSAVQNPAFEE